MILNNMNQDNFHKGIEEIKNLKLKAEEKSLLFSRLDEYSGVIESVPSPKVYWYQSIFHAGYAQMAFALVLIVGGGGLVLGSNSALPGEFLYTVKVNLNEPLKGVSLIGTEAKINWEIEKLDRRFEEVEVLAVQGKLDQGKSVEAQGRIESSRKAFDVLVASKETESNEDLQNTLEAKEGAHQRILEKLETYSAPVVKSEIVSFRNKTVAKNKTRAAPVAAMMFSAKVATKESAISTSTFEKKKKVVEAKLKSAETSNTGDNLDKENHKTLEGEVLGDFRTDLKEAQRIFKEAKEKETRGHLDEADHDLNDSLKNLERANVSLKQGLRFSKEALKVNK
jgi:hypothetical protein